MYSDYLIKQNKYATSTRLSTLLDGDISHDKITRFLNSNNFDSQDLSDMSNLKCKKLKKKKGVLILDDMIEEKPYTDENEIIAWRLFIDSIELTLAKKNTIITEEQELGNQFFELKAVMR